jgi:preprotein translocase subunit SecY
MRILQLPDIRRRIAITGLLLLVYRLGSEIPVPGVNAQAAKDVGGQFGGNGVLGLLNTFTGGGLSRLALFALGVTPYVTASIIIQLLSAVLPSLEKLRKDGEVGFARITQYTRYLTIALAFAQAIGYAFLFRSFGAGAGEAPIVKFDAPHVLLIVVTLTAGTALVMWIGETITQRGIGNGISLIIFAGIVARLPHGVQAWWTSPDPVFKVIMPFIVLAVLAGVVFVQDGQRRIPIQYARRVIGQRMSDGNRTYLPLRINNAGVIPVIFAASLTAVPPAVAQMINTPATRSLANAFNANGAPYLIGQSVLIVVFTYFYTAVTFNPVDNADDLKRYGGFVPGIRPGHPTARYLDRVLARLTLPGALFLALIAALPTILIDHTTATFSFGGTSLLIVIGVALDTVRQAQAQAVMRDYGGYLKAAA